MTTDQDSIGVAIFASRESGAVLGATFESVVVALATFARSCIDVLVNGNPALAADFAAALARRAPFAAGLRVRAWDIALADKANSWNRYVHEIFLDAEYAVCVDGYAKIRPDSIGRLATSLRAHPECLAATGIPSSNASDDKLAAEMLRSGGIHGNLFALSQTAVQKIRRCGFRLPLYLYRTDSTIGAALCFNLAPESAEWNAARIFVDRDVTSTRRVPSWRTWQDLTAQLKRTIRQAQGELENRAVKKLLAIKRQGLNRLPRTTSELINQWLAEATLREKFWFVGNPLRNYAYSRVMKVIPTVPRRAHSELLLDLSPAGAAPNELVLDNAYNRDAQEMR